MFFGYCQKAVSSRLTYNNRTENSTSDEMEAVQGLVGPQEKEPLAYSRDDEENRKKDSHGLPPAVIARFEREVSL